MRMATASPFVLATTAIAFLLSTISAANSAADRQTGDMDTITAEASVRTNAVLINLSKLRCASLLLLLQTTETSASTGKQ